MNWLNNLFTLVSTTTDVATTGTNESQLIWIVLGGLFLIIIIAVVISVVSTAASAAAISTEDDTDE